jgi:CDP-glycerol glycerophosphotransferase
MRLPITFIKKLMTTLRNIPSANRLRGALYMVYRKHSGLAVNTILLESHRGTDFTGNPHHMARLLLSSPRYAQYRLVIVGPRKKTSSLRVPPGRDVVFCAEGSAKYCRYLATAALLVNDTTFPVYFSRRDGQKYLNTWHGTPLKALGRRTAQDTFTYLSNTQRNLLHATHVLAPNRHTEDALLRDYMVERAWTGTVLRGGYPRNDALLAPIGPMLSSDQHLHVAFMPTWRGTLSSKDAANRKLLDDTASLLARLDDALPERIVVWVRLHPLVGQALDLSGYRRVRPFPVGAESYDHLGRCDALVTDYSSVLFDFAASGRPVLLHMPDLATYREERDFCLDPEGLPFPRFSDTESLIAGISALQPGQQARFPDFIATYCPYDDGNATAKLCAEFVEGVDAIPKREVRPSPERVNLLLFAGSFLNNGITTSLKCLVACIDRSKYNIFICLGANAAEANGGTWFHQLDQDVGFIVTRNWLGLTPLEAIGFALRDLFGLRWNAHGRFLQRVWTREYRRLFGSARFDAFVHFTGYDRRAAFLMLGAASPRVIFVHIEMLQETRSKAMDARALRMAYDLADRIAVVRPGLERGYDEAIQKISHKVIHVANTVPTDCIERSRQPLERVLHSTTSPGDRERFVNIMSREAFTFVNLARFSREKGQVRLIEGFEQVYARESHARLVILGGYGPELDAVRLRAQQSTAREAIYVGLGSTNPFPLLAKAGAFVLPSIYEGLPLVLFECLALGVPIIATEIPGPAEFLAQGYGLLVENSTRGIVEGLNAALAGQLPTKPYDLHAHNREAVAMFHRAIHPTAPGAE